jgi:hypothetical protein
MKIFLCSCTALVVLVTAISPSWGATHMQHSRRTATAENYHHTNAFFGAARRRSAPDGVVSSHQKKRNKGALATPGGGGGGIAKSDDSPLQAGIADRRILAFLAWAVPLFFYVKGFPLTLEFVRDLVLMVQGEFTPYLEQWKEIGEIQGVIPGVLNHILFGSPSVALYLVASFCLFPAKSSGRFYRSAGAFFSIPASILLVASLGGAFQVIYALSQHPNSQGIFLWIATGAIVLTTMPFLQLVVWEIEYALRTLKGTPGKRVLPGFLLYIVSFTNMLGLLVDPLKKFFEWSIFPKAYSESGQAVVMSIYNANYYSKEKNAAGLTKEGLDKIVAGLLVQVLYASLAVIPMWAVLTNFGLFPVTTPASRCAFSKIFLNLLDLKNWADLGILGMLLPYWVFSFLWLLWGVGIYSAYIG